MKKDRKIMVWKFPRGRLTCKIKRLIKHSLVVITFPFYYKKRRKAFAAQFDDGVTNIPIFLICFNRLSYVSQMVSQLERLGFTNINLIDNCSTYKPLLNYYEKCGHNVFYMKENLGHMVFWKDDIFKRYRQNFYVVSDPDLEISEECPGNFLEIMLVQLQRHYLVRKVGFSLRIDDLPINDIKISKLKQWEERYYKIYYNRDNVYYADIDTTFALYLPDQLVSFHDFYDALRTGYPCQVRHLPWYISEDNVSEEDKFYFSSQKNGTFNPIDGFIIDEERKRDL